MLIGAIILAGGRSRRMGKPKESLPIGDSTLLGHTSEVLLDCTYPVLIVARSEDQELPPLPLEVEITYDEEPDQGPLSGLRTGLNRISDQCDAAFVTGCDAPYLTTRAVGWLADQLGDFEAVMPKTDDKLQPLCAIYRCNTLEKITQLLEEGERQPRALADHLRTFILGEDKLREFDPGLKLLRGVNTPEEYARAMRDTGTAGL